ncbi:hypothetical protein [Corynebacterium heidelbergense]|uniref:Uncharacterized protein n=1 Tax=Corynebacterium heidelbergense TaxID=2055947 RepID=A0A364V8W9_9CORY|nr:hypothetical protein [Corynebacterium heidelbergense]RAV33067.1 hypothetical protein DLJ54_00530 [Corynebacterium heidelbergense]
MIGKPTILFAGTGHVSDAIRGDLADLMALGLIDSFLWADTSLDPAATPFIRCFERGNGGMECHLRDINHALRESQHQVAVVSLVPVEEPGHHDAPGEGEASGGRHTAAATPGVNPAGPFLARWVSEVEGRLGRAATRVRILLPRFPQPDTIGIDVGDYSWPTFALAPEDSEVPGAPVMRVERRGDPEEVARQAAYALAGAFGLWHGMREAPLLSGGGIVSTGDAHGFRLLRVYHRQLDATRVEYQLRQAASSVKERCPEPSLPDGRQVIRCPQYDELTDSYADSLFAAHAGTLRSPEPTRTEVNRQKISAWAAVAAFFKFFFRSVIGTPRDWAAGTAASARSAFASSVQNLLYGKNQDAVEVVCGEQSGKRQQRSISELDSVSERLRVALQDDARQQLPTNEGRLGAFWSAYRDYSLTLVDGSPRGMEANSHLMQHSGGSAGFGTGPQLQIRVDENQNPQIVMQPWQSVPDESQKFEGYSPVFRNYMERSKADCDIMPWDFYAAQRYENDLHWVARQTTDRSVSAKATQFGEWKRMASRSFAWKVGQRLVGVMQQAQGEARDAHHRLPQLIEALRGFGDDEALRRKLSFRLRLMFFLWLLLQVIIGYFGICYYREDWRLAQALPGYDWRWTLLLVVVTTVILLALSMWMFARVHRGMLARVQERERLVAEIDFASEMLARAVADVNVLSGAYGQFLSWSTILGRCVNLPLGQPLGDVHNAAIPQAGLNRSTAFGEIDAQPEDFKQAVTAVRNQLFEPSWTQIAFDSLLADAAAEVAREEGVSVTNPASLVGQRGYGTGSQLDLIARAAISPRVASGQRSTVRWAETIGKASLRRPLEQLLARARYFDGGTEQVVSTQEFINRLSAQSDVPSQFATGSLNDEGLNARGGEVERQFTKISQAGGLDAAATERSLSRSFTLVQVGHHCSLGFLSRTGTVVDPDGRPEGEPAVDPSQDVGKLFEEFSRQHQGEAPTSGLTGGSGAPKNALDYLQEKDPTQQFGMGLWGDSAEGRST